MLTRDLPLDIVRRCYAEEVRAVAGLRSRALAEAFAVVPREHYLGPGPWQLYKPVLMTYVPTETADPRELYHDVLVGIDLTKTLNNGQPSGLAAWMDHLELQSGERLVHVGCGVGYYTAVMAHVVGATGHVTAVEIDPVLAERARANLNHLPQVEVLCADGVTHDAGFVDAIFVNAGVTHPQTLWLERLNANGRMVVPITASFTVAGAATSVPAALGMSGMGQMLRVRRVADGYEAAFVSPVGIFSSPTGRDPDYNTALAQRFRDPLSGGRRPTIRTLRREPHTADESCWLHGHGFCLSTREVMRSPSVAPASNSGS